MKHTTFALLLASVLAPVVVACGGGAPPPDTPAAPRMCPIPSLTPACNAADGLGAPLVTCSPEAPCTLASGTSQTLQIDIPTCTPTGAAVADEVRHWIDANREDRYACVFTPPGAAAAPRPLLVFFHGSHGSADDAYRYTGLRDKAATVDLSASAGARPGFVLAAMQGRYLHWYGPNPPATHHDYFYRDLGTDSCNPDVRSADRLIDDLVATGTVDPSRIYVAGWSNGAFFSEMYAIARNETPTPRGNHVAAAIAYAGADPFANLPSLPSPSCALAPYPTSTVPIYAIHRDCDTIVACDPSQAAGYVGMDVEAWIGALASQVHDANVTQVIIDKDAAQVGSCAASCGAVQGALNHVRWPDGKGNDGLTDWEPAMLDFLRTNLHR